MPNPRRPARLLAAAVLTAAAGAALAAGPATQPVAGPATQPVAAGGPQYKLAVGQELTYTVKVRAESARRGRPVSMSEVLTYRVVGRTPDGAGWHVVKQSPNRNGGSNVSAFNVWPDGHQTGDAAGEPSADDAFPPLPPTPAADHWAVADRFGTKTDYHAAPATRPATLDITAAEEPTDLTKIYQQEQTQADTFDAARGLMVRSVGTLSRGFNPAKQTVTLTLAGEKTLPADETAKFAAQAAGALGAVHAYGEAMEGADKAADPAAARQAALDHLKAAQASAQDGPFADLLSEAVDQHPEVVKEMTETKRDHDAMVGHPAPAFDLVDLDGVRHSMAAERGKVVVMDFWYRGCPWCLRAMPEIKRLAEAYKQQGKPVQFLGMNSDPDARDARFVADYFALPYPTVMMETTDLHPTTRPTFMPEQIVPQAYHVTGYPCLFLVGPDGVVKQMNVGYSTTLHDDLKKSIDDLLAAAPAADVR